MITLPQSLVDLMIAFPMPGWAWILVWFTLLALPPLIGWGIAILLAPDGSGSRVSRGAGALGLVPPGLVLVAVLLRFFVWFFDGPAGGPTEWLIAWTHAAQVGAETWNLAWALLTWMLFYGSAIPVVAFGAGLIHHFRRRTRPFQVPEPNIAAVILLFGAFVTGPISLWAFRTITTTDTHHLMDLMAIGPLSLVCLAVWTRFSWAPRLRPEDAPEEVAPDGPVGPDVVSLWKKIGALRADAQPFFISPARPAAAGAGGAPGIAWRHAGGSGPAPEALGELFASWQEPDQGWLVPDLPDPTERTFLTAALLLAIREHGLPCLVVTQSPRRLRDAVEAAIRASGAWSCGPLVVGEEDLRAAFAGGRMPAAAFIDVEDLSAEGIRALAGDLDGAGAGWARNIGLLVLSQADRGDPLSVTHRLFTLQRLGLAMQAVEARWSILATGFGGESTRAMVEKAFPGVPMREVPLGGRACAEVRVWLADARFREQPGPPWVKRAAEPIVAADCSVSVGDPGGLFGQRGVEIWGGQVRLIRDVALAGAASASALNEAWLVASFRALSNRLPVSDSERHDALWGLSDNPVTRFLTRDQNLLGLDRSGQLKPPQPLFGAANRLVARTHLQASLREGQQSLPALEGVFGRSLVDEVLGHNFVPDRHAVRRHQGRLQRVPLAPMQADADAQALRNTVTSRVVAVRHTHSGQQLAECDAVCAATRYYPGRVFAVGEERFRVPPQAFDVRRAQILVEPVPADQPLTRPHLTIDVTGPVLVEAPQEYRDASMSFRMASFEAQVRENVSGFRRSDRSEQRYDTVSASYRTRVRGVFFDTEIGHNALFHLSRSFDGVLVAHLFAAEEDLEVFPTQPGFTEGMPAGILTIDRFILGMGAAEAMRPLVVRDVLRWVVAILAGCKCPYGCDNCTPRDVLDRGPDKPGVLRALGHR
ncbi:MAG: hypothetical protein ACI8S6_002840 [Myxococcota bacterium]|jgi:hypothetical protein